MYFVVFVIYLIAPCNRIHLLHAETVFNLHSFWTFFFRRNCINNLFFTITFKSRHLQLKHRLHSVCKAWIKLPYQRTKLAELNRTVPDGGYLKSAVFLSMDFESMGVVAIPLSYSVLPEAGFEPASHNAKLCSNH